MVILFHYASDSCDVGSTQCAKPLEKEKFQNFPHGGIVAHRNNLQHEFSRWQGELGYHKGLAS